MSKPTEAQKRLWGRIFEAGCVACRKEGKFSFPEIHHWREYGYRDHSKVFGLCPAHHRPGTAVPGVPNRHGQPIEFRERYRTDEELFAENMKRIGEKRWKQS